MPAIVLGDHAVIPAWVQDHASFCRWALSAEYPERGQFSFLGDHVWVDVALEAADHNDIKAIVGAVLLLTVREFAAERLSGSDEAAAVTERFLGWALETATLGDPVLHRDAPGNWPELLVEARNLLLVAQLLLDADYWASFTQLAWGVFHLIYRFGDIKVFAGWAERALRQSGDPKSDADRASAARLHSVVCWSRFLLHRSTPSPKNKPSVPPYNARRPCQRWKMATVRRAILSLWPRPTARNAAR